MSIVYNLDYNNFIYNLDYNNFIYNLDYNNSVVFQTDPTKLGLIWNVVILHESCNSFTKSIQFLKTNT
jgi:hypothetical protein